WKTGRLAKEITMLHGVTEKEPNVAPHVTQEDLIEIDVPRHGKNLRVRKLGRDGQPTILFQHGIQSHSGVWERIARPLAEKGFQVLMPDRRGHGLSDHF